jgi:hypothetical protein
VILGAGLLVLAGLGLFVAGVLTGVTALYWACVAVCAVAAILLIASRRKAPPARAAESAPEKEAPRKEAPRKQTPTTAETPQVSAAAAHRDDAPAAEPTTTVSEVPTSESPAHEPEPADPEPAAAETPTGLHATAHRTGAAGATAAHPATGASTTGSFPAQGRGAHAAADVPHGGAGMHEPGVEEVEVTDLLLVVDLTDEVLVVDEHPRYHLEGCRFLGGRETFPLPLDEARTDGFTPCALCAPDRHLADRERARKAARGH